MEVAISIFGIFFLIFGILELRKILKDRGNAEFYTTHRLSINAIVISIFTGVFTLFNVFKQLLNWINQH
jgi:uncharacterized membrane protein HdeD (DUF308 family)